MTLIWINNKYSPLNRREKIDGDSPPSEKRIFNTFSISIILEFEPNDGSMRLSLECCPLPTTRSRKKNNDEGKKKWFPLRRIQFDLIWFKDATISYLSTFSGSNNTATSEMITAIVKWLVRVSLLETNTLTDLPYPCPNLYLWKSPYTPFLLSTWWNEQELLYDNHLCINGSKIEETGFCYNYPELRIEFLREVSAPTLHRTQVV